MRAAMVSLMLAATVPGAAGAAPALLFDEEFNGSTLNPAVWYPCYPWAGEPRGCTNRSGIDLEWYLPGNLSVAGGHLNLTARRQTVHDHNYTAGLAATGGGPRIPAGFTYLYGYAEARMKFPPGQGMWPAFWMLPADGSWPPEIDAVEGQGGRPRIDYATLHWGKQVRGQHPFDTTPFDTGVDLSADFHTYGVDWQPGHVTWYFDGRIVKTYREAANIPHKPMYVLLDLAVGGWISFPDRSTHFPAVMQVDYVRVWSAYPGAGGR